ncbi:MAG: hypothetical protein LKI24_05335 [Acidipropionibacterium sp.]|nr:hypothetical protein [Acidipropionibacterium sp.]
MAGPQAGHVVHQRRGRGVGDSQDGSDFEGDELAHPPAADVHRLSRWRGGRY